MKTGKTLYSGLPATTEKYSEEDKHQNLHQFCMNFFVYKIKV